MLYLLIFCAGGLGSLLRYGLDSYLRPRLGWGKLPYMPLSTFFINVSGSLLLGLTVGLIGQSQLLLGQVAGRDLEGQITLLLGLGFLGGYTTFSTALLEALRSPGPLAQLFLTLGQLLCSSLAAASGLILAASFFS